MPRHETPGKNGNRSRDVDDNEAETNLGNAAVNGAVNGQSDTAENQKKLTEDVDALLDEIDDVLETNAEDFVRSFVQKGGQ